MIRNLKTYKTTLNPLIENIGNWKRSLVQHGSQQCYARAAQTLGDSQSRLSPRAVSLQNQHYAIRELAPNHSIRVGVERWRIYHQIVELPPQFRYSLAKAIAV